ncbi:MAG: ComF family protein [Phycisphaerae bacterium]|jgi:ComF family protein
MEAVRTKQILRVFSNSINHLVWPAVCINCRAAILDNRDRLCRDCWSEMFACAMDSSCPRCGVAVSLGGIINGRCPHCQGKEIYFDGIKGCGIYENTLRSLILKFKNSHSELASILGSFAKAAFESCGFAGQIDYFVPVPLHWRRLLKRGYNQSKLIARRLSSRKIKINNGLIRIRHTAAQPNMTSPTARARNVAGAFAVKKGNDFAGKNICLIDDIKTSGATLNECAKTLKLAGVEKVYAIVLAIAGQ